jgi:hypothetical protein
VEQITLESNGNLLLGGDASGSVNYWWIGELLPGGAPVQTFGASNGGYGNELPSVRDLVRVQQ